MATAPITTQSRYTTPAQQAALASPPDVKTQGLSAGTTAGTSETTANTESRQVNMDPQSMAALQTLIQQLMGGGTPAMRADLSTRKGEIGTLQGQRAGFSKEAAFSDAQGLMAQTMRKALEALVPSINRAAEGAGTSQGSLRALLLQDAASRAAESSAAQGLGAAVQYGGIGASLSQVLEALTRPDSTVSNALINALGIAKGANVYSNSTTNQTTNTTGNTTGQDAKTIDYAPFGNISPTLPTVGGNVTVAEPLMGESEGDRRARATGSTADLLSQLLGGDPFASYTP